MPKSVQELRAFLELLNYYGQFIPNQPTLTKPLNSLLCKDSHWKWTGKCTKVFQLIKNTLAASTFLTSGRSRGVLWVLKNPLDLTNLKEHQAQLSYVASWNKCLLPSSWAQWVFVPTLFASSRASHRAAAYRCCTWQWSGIQTSMVCAQIAQHGEWVQITHTF